MLDVLLARIVESLQIESRSEKVENFSSGISGIASTTRSQSASFSRPIRASMEDLVSLGDRVKNPILLRKFCAD